MATRRRPTMTTRRAKRKSSIEDDDDEIKTKEVYEVGTINDPTLMDICTQAKVPFTGTLRDTCKTLVKKVVEKDSCATRQSLIYISELLQVAILPKTTKKNILTQLLLKLEDSSKSCDIKDKIISAAIVEIDKKVEEREEKVVEKSNLENVRSVETISTIIYNRKLTIVPVPENCLFKNREGQTVWKISSNGKRYSCMNCPFYFSTGTSNPGKNYADTWFPFGRVKESEPDGPYNKQVRGWLSKVVGLHNNKLLLNALKIKGVEIDEMLICFLEKFDNWWQVSVSAALPSGPNSVWVIHPEFVLLKHLALTNTYEWFSDTDLKNDRNIITQYVVADATATYETPEQVNGWLNINDALLYDQSYDRIT